MASTIRGSDNFDSAYGAALKAWVNFNGTGTVAIRASLNVSSITDNGTGDYTVNLTNALADTNYAVVGSGQIDTTGGAIYSAVGIYRNAASKTVSSCRLGASSIGSTPSSLDMYSIEVGFLR